MSSRRFFDRRRPSGRAPTKHRFGPGHLLLAVLAGAGYLLLSYIPLAGSELWLNVAWGSWILEHRALPSADPFVPLAAGMEVVDGEWLSQVILAAVDRVAGGEGLSLLFTLTVLATLLFLARACFVAGGSLFAGTLGALAILALAWGRFAALRPQSFGLLCFTALLWLVAANGAGDDEEEGAEAPKGRRLMLGVPLIFVLWANLDASFAAGWALLGCLFLGRVIDVLRRTRSPRAVLADSAMRRWLYVLEMAVAATLVNPYGVRLLVATHSAPGMDNLRQLPDWQPLEILGPGGRGLALSCVALLFLLRASHRRLAAAHVLLLLVFGWVAAHGTRFLGWYGLVFALVLAPHLADILDRWQQGRAGLWLADLARPSKIYLPLAIVLVWIALIFSPLGGAVLGHEGRTPRQLYGAAAPLALAEHLRDDPPRGLVLAPRHWGDWLAAQGPPGIELLATSGAGRIPRRVWRDHQRVAAGDAVWPRLLDRYRVETAVVDKAGQPNLAEAMRRAADWRPIYEDERAMVLARSLPEASPAAGSAEEPASPAPEAGP